MSVTKSRSVRVAGCLLAAMGTTIVGPTMVFSASKPPDEAIPDPCKSRVGHQAPSPNLHDLLEVAACHQRAGRAATAWAEFREVELLASRDKRTREYTAAQRQSKALEPILCLLKITLEPGIRPPGLEILIDDKSMGDRGAAGTVPVDPGTHELTADAPGFVHLSQWITVTPKDRNVAATIRLTRSTDSSSTPASTPPSSPSGGDSPGSRPVGHSPTPGGNSLWVNSVGAVGFAGVLLSGIYGLQAFQKWNAYVKRCPDDVCINPRDESFADDARHSAKIANVSLGIGLTAAAVAAFLFFSSRDSDKQTDTTFRAFVPAISSEFVGISVGASL